MSNKQQQARRAYDLAAERFFALAESHRQRPPGQWSATEEQLYRRWHQRLEQAAHKLERLAPELLDTPLSPDAFAAQENAIAAWIGNRSAEDVARLFDRGSASSTH